MNTEPTWRVYLTEWMFVYTADSIGPAGRGECEGFFDRNLTGRVRDEDWRVVPAVAGRRTDVWCLQLRLLNLKGEFKDYDDAVTLAGELVDRHPDAVCTVVQRGSAEERLLLEYGKKLLPGAG